MVCCASSSWHLEQVLSLCRKLSLPVKLLVCAVLTGGAVTG